MEEGKESHWDSSVIDWSQVGLGTENDNDDGEVPLMHPAMMMMRYHQCTLQ